MPAHASPNPSQIGASSSHHEERGHAIGSLKAEANQTRKEMNETSKANARRAQLQTGLAAAGAAVPVAALGVTGGIYALAHRSKNSPAK